MTWFKVDDSFYDHPKVYDAPDCAVALWTRAGTWSARNLTDGFVPTGMPARLCDDPDTAVKELVRRGLWKKTTGGFKFHDWRDFQPTAEAVKTLREQRSAAGRKGGQAKAAQANGKQVPGNSQASASPVAKQNAAPTRPDPSLEGGSSTYVPHGGAREELPAPQCPDHINDPTPPPCGACGRARARRAAAEAERNRRLAEAPKCRRHRGQLADNCAPCRAERIAAPDDDPEAETP